MVEIRDGIALSPALLGDLGVHDEGASELVEDDPGIALVDDAEGELADDIVLHCNYSVVAYALGNHDEIAPILC
jgi:hypothetical protein